MKIDLLNTIQNRPRSPRSSVEGRSIANVGNYHLSQAYGGACLHETANEGGGVRDIFSSGHIPKRELYNRLCAFIQGIETQNK